MPVVKLEMADFSMPRLGPDGELILDSGGGRLPTPDEERMLGVGERHAQRPPTALPYRYQDDYDRTHHPVAHRVATLDNGRLRATFLPDLGGRLWRLQDLSSGRDLLHHPDSFHFANLALRNAWFAGGVEWNLGVTGHWGLTCTPVCAGIVEDDVLRLWAHERLLGITWRLDAWLPDGSDTLFTHVVIRNRTTEALPVYWWSNISVPQDHDTMTLVSAERAFHFGYAYALSEVDVPVRNGHDVSWPQRHHGSADYFYLTDEPWIASVGADGYGLGQASTRQLTGRKMFTWGDGSGGRTWQRWLSGDGAYAEIQAGLASTQLEHLNLEPGATWRFTESYRAVEVDQPDGPWPQVVARARAAALDGEQLDTAHAHLTGLEDAPVRPEGATLRGTSSAQGWGALEVAVGHADHDPATPYDTDQLDDEQAAWLALASDGTVDPLLQRSAMVSRPWRRHLANAEPGWLTDLLLGHAEHAAGETDQARRLWEASAAAHPTPDAWRALALTAADDDERLALLVRAHELDRARPRIAVEAVTALLDMGQPTEALALVHGLPASVRGLPRIAYLEALALVRSGDGDGAAQLLARPLVLPDLREGDLGLDRLWDEHQRLVGADDPLPAHYDFRMVTEEN